MAPVVFMNVRWSSIKAKVARAFNWKGGNWQKKTARNSRLAIGCGSVTLSSGQRGEILTLTRQLKLTMEITKQLAIFLDNRPGTLAKVVNTLAEAGINIYAITTSDTVDHSVIRLVLSDYRKALHLFEDHGTLVVEDDVVMMEGANRPGELAQIARKLARAKVNIEYCYSATPPDATSGLLIMRVSDPDRALKALQPPKGKR